MGIVMVAALAATRGGCALRCGDDSYPPANQLRRQPRQAIIVTFTPTIFDRDILTFDITGFAQPFAECVHVICKGGSRCAVKEPDHRHRRLLRARR
jgi:hypothetical protein